ncbi:MAG: NAD(P)-binding domain-containing protein [Paludibacter sp.]|jgi:thioredoxin reductase (NADPH)
MELQIEQIAIYGFTALIIVLVLVIYIWRQRRESKIVDVKISQAKEDGLHEPVSLYPVIDPNRCIGSGACVDACPEKDILGLKNGSSTIINASHCIGHGACFRACPLEAISLWIGTEKRGVDIPHLSVNFESNVKGIFIAGELGGMGLIKNAVTQGFEAVEYIAKSFVKDPKATYDLIVVGSGPAGISATLAAKKFNLSVLTLEQGTLGGTISTFPRSKVIMTSPMDLPLYGKVKLRETSKSELLDLWNSVISKHNIEIRENSKVEEIKNVDNIFYITTSLGETYTSKKVLLAIGRRGTPKKLNVPGEESEKVAYRLLEPEVISDKKILVVGGGDSAVESALLLAGRNKVILSYRKSVFNRIKKKNADKINAAMQSGLIDVQFNTNLVSINEGFISYNANESDEILKWENDMVYIFAGGELPSQFLKNIGIEVSTKRGEAILKHN